MSTDFNDYTYLYVEDDPLSQEVMRVTLEDMMGVEKATIFQDSRDFLQRLHALPHKPDIILLDIHMQPHNGFALLRMIRESRLYDEARIIALTASVMSDEVQQLRSQGFDGAIAKPLNVTEFPALIERILHGESVWQIV